VVLVSWHRRDANGATVTSLAAGRGWPKTSDRSIGRRESQDEVALLSFRSWYLLQYMGMDQYLLIPFLVGWTSINPSYFDVNYRGTRFWHTAIWRYTIYEDLNYFVVEWIAICQDFVHQCMNMCRTVHVNKSMSCENYNILCIYIYVYVFFLENTCGYTRHIYDGFLQRCDQL